MDRRLGKWLSVALRPPLLAIGFVAGHLHRLFFSRSDERLAREHEEKLAVDIHTYLPFLFTDMGGRIIPNEGVEFPPPFDYAIVTIDVSHILLRFTRGRDHLAVQVAPKSFPNLFSELSTILSVLEVAGIQRGSITGLAQAAQLLRQNNKDIAHAFTEDQYPYLKAKLEDIYARDRIITKQLETELNRNLYG